jgi:hypothetical protein
LREGVGARALGMGNAQTAASQDASAVFWDPALLALSPNDTSIASQTAVVGWNRSWNFISAAHADPDGQPERFAYAASWLGFSAGNDIEARSANRPDPDYIFRDYEQAIMVSLADSFSPGFSLGGTIKYLMQELANSPANGFGLDLAISCRIMPETTYALVLQDLYSVLNWNANYSDRLPLYLRLGAAQQILEPSLLVCADLGVEYVQTAVRIADVRYHLGMEYRPVKTLAIRGGLDSGRWTAGIGWQFSVDQMAWVHLDYALAGPRAGDEGLTHFLSLVLNVPAKFEAQ